MIFQKFPSGPLDTNAILFGCSETRQAVVIDPAHESTAEILAEVKENQLTIQAILLTHSHWDHIADVAELKKATNAPVYVHPLDIGNLENPGSDGIPLFFPIHGTKPDFLLQEGRSIQVGNVSIQVIHSPGHSPGSVCFYVPKQSILFSGDTLFQGTIGTLNLPTAQPMKMWDSLRKLSLLPPETHVVPGHGADTTIEEESWLNRAEEIFKD